MNVVRSIYCVHSLFCKKKNKRWNDEIVDLYKIKKKKRESHRVVVFKTKQKTKTKENLTHRHDSFGLNQAISLHVRD